MIVTVQGRVIYEGPAIGYPPGMAAAVLLRNLTIYGEHIQTPLHPAVRQELLLRAYHKREKVDEEEL